MTGTQAPASAASPASTSTDATPRQIWTRTRGLLLAAVILLVAGITLAATRSGDQHGRLDPRSADRYGSRAVAELLRGQGVSTRVATTLDEATRAAGPDTTLLVTVPDLLTASQQHRLHAATTESGGRTVLLAPGAPSFPYSPLAYGKRARSRSATASRTAPCPWPPAPEAPTPEVSATPPTARPATPVTPQADCPPCSGYRLPLTATPSCSAPRTSSTTTVSTSRATPRSPSNSSAPAPIWSGTSPRSVMSRPPTAVTAASSTSSRPAGSGPPSSSPSRPPSPPSGEPAASARW